jgi:hypothetical protein
MKVAETGAGAGPRPPRLLTTKDLHPARNGTALAEAASMGLADSFDDRGPFRPPPLFSLLPLLALLWAASARSQTAPGPGAADPPPPEPARAEETAASERMHWGPVYPSVAILSAGASVAPMLQLWERDLAGSGLDVQAAAAYSLRRYQLYALRVGRLPRRGAGPPSFSTSSDRLYPLSEMERMAGGSEERADVYLSYRHRHYPEEDFYGSGPDAREADRSDFRLRDHLVELVGAYHASPRLTLVARTGVLSTSLGGGRDGAVPDVHATFGEAGAPGLGLSPRQVILAGGLLADRRDDPRDPRRGGLLLAGFSRFEGEGAGFDFTRLSADLRLYRALGSERHVLAARALGSFDRPDAGAQVPFYLQSSLGGSQVLRGYRAFRFRDERLVAFSVEYRFEAHPRVELAAFVDAGQVAPAGTGFRLGDPHAGWGVGLRVKSQRRVVLRLDVARSPETTRYLVKLGPAF